MRCQDLGRRQILIRSHHRLDIIEYGEDVVLIGHRVKPDLLPGEEVKTRTQQTPRYSQEQLDRIRQSFMARIAVWDSAENAMRAASAYRVTL